MRPHSSSPHTGSGVVSKASPYSVEETVTRLEELVHERGLTLLARIDHGYEAHKAGLRMHEAQLLLIGDARASTRVLEASPLAGLDLPHRVLVWEDSDGQVWVSYNSVTFLAARHALPGGLVEDISGVDALVDGVVRGEVSGVLEAGAGPV